MKALTHEQLETFLHGLAAEFDVRAPVALHDGTRTLARLGEGPLALGSGAVRGKPLSMFFPQCDTTLWCRDQQIEVQTPAAKPLLVVGLTAQDADCLEFTDRFFAERFRDDVYFNKRDGALVAVVSGRCGPGGELLKIAGGKCDFELVCDGARFLVVPYTEAGERLCERVQDGAAASPGELEKLRQESDALDTSFAELIQRASQLLRANQVPDGFWQEIADRCIGCTACNLVCPSCTCFDVYDWKCGREVARHRLWDSCQLAGFAREASGYNPMGTEGLRTRRRIYHKLAADPERWGTITCFLCGRCDKACPSGIGIEAVSREIVARFG